MLLKLFVMKGNVNEVDVIRHTIKHVSTIQMPSFAGTLDEILSFVEYSKDFTSSGQPTENETDSKDFIVLSD